MTLDGSQDLDGLHRDVVVVGGGQAGLSVSRCLVDRAVPHLVLERDRIGHEWRTAAGMASASSPRT